MAIENYYGKYNLICDCCNDIFTFDDFNEAVEYKKDFGWKSEKISNEWFDYCPDCKD